MQVLRGATVKSVKDAARLTSDAFSVRCTAVDGANYTDVLSAVVARPLVTRAHYQHVIIPLPTVFRLDALALSVIATATWLAGWVSVTLRYCIKTAKPIRKLFRPSESCIILVF